MTWGQNSEVRRSRWQDHYCL